MNGRLENELKIENIIMTTLLNMPDFVTEWYYNLKASNIEASSCNDFINKIRRFLIFINEDIKNITPKDITLAATQKYFISIQKKIDKNGNLVYTSNSYQYSIWCALHNFLNFMTNRKYINENYIQLIQRPKNNDLDRINENRVLLTKKDFNKIINSVNRGVGSKKAIAHQQKFKSRDLSIIMLFMTTGMRREALSEINIEDLDLEEKRLTVIDKGMKRHVYTLSDKVIDSVNEWISLRETIKKNNNALFISGNGKRMTGSAIYKLVVKYCDDALGIHVSPHKLRSGFCSILYEEKGDIEFVRRAVGHSNISTTQRYIVTKNNEKTEASNLISSFL